MVIVLDVLFATTSIAAALAHGATEVIPTLDGDAARAVAAARPPGSFVLAGEYGAETLPGFAHPTPLALLDLPLAGRALVYSTTNGTVAVHKAAGASRVYAAALGNGAAVVEHVVRAGRGGDRPPGLLRLGRRLQPGGLLRRRPPGLALHPERGRAGSSPTRRWRRRSSTTAATRSTACRGAGWAG